MLAGLRRAAPTVEQITDERWASIGETVNGWRGSLASGAMQLRLVTQRRQRHAPDRHPTLRRSVYVNTRVDADDQPLDGANNYTLPTSRGRTDTTGRRNVEPGDVRPQPSSSSTGTTSPTRPSPCCASKPVATRTTATSPTSSANAPPVATTSRIRWAGDNVRLHDHGDKRFDHPVVGDLTLSFEELPLPADPGLTITAYTAEPGTASHDALDSPRQLGHHDRPDHRTQFGAHQERGVSEPTHDIIDDVLSRKPDMRGHVGRHDRGREKGVWGVQRACHTGQQRHSSPSA